MSREALAAREGATSAYEHNWLKESVREAVLSAVLADVPVAKERIDVRLKPGFSTAAWAYVPPHRVYVGDRIRQGAREGLSDEQHRQYVTSFVFHEFAHALWSDRDLAELRSEVEAIASFKLFNLFEDARIEHRYRTEYGRTFGWLDFEVAQFSEQPVSILFAFVQAEGDRAAVDALAGGAGKDLQALIDQVEAFYRRAIEAESSRALLPVLREWVEQFGQPPLSEEPADLELGAELQSDPTAREEFEVDTVAVSGEKKAPGRGGGGSGEAQSVEVTEVEGSTNLLVEERTPIRVDRTRKVTERLARFFTAEVRTVSTNVVSRRISVRNYVVGKPYFRRAETKQRTRRKVLLIVDCSGSMDGYHIQEGQVLIAALSELARRRAVSGHVVLSCVLDKAHWQRFTLPMPLELIEHIGAYGYAEGLEFSLRANIELARAADHVFVYTDGQICDAPINKKALHAQGIFTWGLYAGTNQRVLRELVRYFDKAILREDAEQLVEAMLAQRS